MSKEHLEQVINRARENPDFASGLAGNFERTVKFAGYQLEPDEMETAKQELKNILSSAKPSEPQPDQAFQFNPAAQAAMLADFEFQRDLVRKRMKSQLARLDELGAYTVKILKDTLDNARSAYHRITLMNTIMFLVGMSLLIFAALYAAFSQQQKIYSLVFGGLGVANFIAIFIIKPIERTQTALSNLVQVEIAFMNYFEQITMWDTYAAPKGNPPILNPADIEKASALLQERSRETIDLLQKYIEGLPGTSSRKGRKRAAQSEA